MATARRASTHLAIVGLGLALLAPAGCLYHAHSGPPPWAPAHGHRHQHRGDGVELTYDSGLGVYVVLGMDDCYFHRDYYYRLVNGTWAVSARLNGPWEVVTVQELPPGLRGNRAHHRRKHHPHRPGPARHDH